VLSYDSKVCRPRRPQPQGNQHNEGRALHGPRFFLFTRRNVTARERFTSGNGLRSDEVNALSRPLTDAAELEVVIGSTHAARVAVAREYLIWGLVVADDSSAQSILVAAINLTVGGLQQGQRTLRNQ
jgi:hypothetical protein